MTPARCQFAALQTKLILRLRDIIIIIIIIIIRINKVVAEYNDAISQSASISVGGPTAKT